MFRIFTYIRIFTYTIATLLMIQVLYMAYSFLLVSVTYSEEKIIVACVIGFIGFLVLIARLIVDS